MTGDKSNLARIRLINKRLCSRFKTQTMAPSKWLLTQLKSNAIVVIVEFKKIWLSARTPQKIYCKLKCLFKLHKDLLMKRFLMINCNLLNYYQIVMAVIEENHSIIQKIKVHKHFNSRLTHSQAKNSKANSQQGLKTRGSLLRCKVVKYLLKGQQRTPRLLICLQVRTSL